MKSRLRDWLAVYLKGFAMGSASAVPGISGGTIALITGIYGRMITAITSVKPGIILEALNSVKNSDLESFEEIFRDLDGYFLLALISGILSAILVVFRFMYYLLDRFPIPTYGFFFGLIAVSIVVLWREVNVQNSTDIAAGLTGFLLAFLTSGYAATSLGHGLPIIFISGMLAISAMLLPGMSGSLLLIILGQYEFISETLTRFINRIIEVLRTGELQNMTEVSSPILTFVLGAIFGVFTVSHVVHKALRSYRRTTMIFLVSLVAGALRAPIVEVEKILVERNISWISVVPEFAMATSGGALIVFLLDKKAGLF